MENKVYDDGIEIIIANASHEKFVDEILDTITAAAKLVEPLMTDAALSNMSFVGSALIFCVGINLLFGKKVRVANLLPSLIFAVVWAFLPL